MLCVDWDFARVCCILFLDKGDTDEGLNEDIKPLPLLILFTVINNDVAFDIHIPNTNTSKQIMYISAMWSNNIYNCYLLSHNSNDPIKRQ